MNRTTYILSATIVLAMMVATIVGMNPNGIAWAAEEGVTFASEHLRFTAYFGDQSVRLRFSDGREVRLPQAIAASGARYFDGTTLFWNKGDDATVILDGVTYEVRVVNPETDPWELAKKSGVQFRAVGQEPGWLLDIHEDKRIFLLLDYGDTQITTTLSLMEVNFWTGTKTYRTLAPASPLDITITVRDEQCYDVMSGEGFTSSVTVQVGTDGRVYYGCGRKLYDDPMG